MGNKKLTYEELEKKVFELEAKLTERVKELNCHSELANLIETKKNINDILSKLPPILKKSWQFPEITEVKITHKDFNYQTENFEETQWKMSSEIIVNEETEGEIQIAYLENSTKYADPFLKEEYDLLQIVTERLEKIIERKKNEEAFKKSEEKYRTLFEGANDAIFLAEVETGIIIDANQKAEILLGYSRNKIIGMHQSELYPEGMSEKAKNIFQTHYKNGNFSFVQGLSVKNKNGEAIPVEISPSIIELNNKKYVYGIFRDITERLEAIKIKESEERFKNMFLRHSATMLLIEPETGAIIDVNDAATKFYGYTKSRLCSLKIDDLNTLSPEQISIERLNAINNKRNYFIFPHKLANGEIHTVEVHSSPIEFQNKRILFSIIHDITKRKKAEEILSQNNKNLNKLNQIAFEFTNLSSNDNLEALIAKQVKEIAHAEVALFSEYNPAHKTLTPKHIEMKPGLLKKVVNLLDTKVQNIYSAVSDKQYREMTSEMIGVRKTLYEISSGAIPRSVSEAIQALLKVDRFIGVAYLLDGKLYGTSILAMGIDQPDPPKKILENFIHLASTTLRRKQAEQALIESENHLLSVIENIPLAVFAHDLDGNFLIVNESSKKYTGYSKKELLSMNVSDIDKESGERKDRKEIWEKLYKTDDFIQLTCTHVRKDKSTYPVEISTTAIKFNKQPIILAVAQDITERKNREAEITKAKKRAEENEEKLQLIGNNIPKGLIFEVIMQRNGNRRFSYLSNKVEDIHECTVEQAFSDSKLIYSRILQEDRSKLQAATEKSIRTMCEFDLEFRIKRKSGKIQWHRIISRPRKLSNGDILFDGIEIDITSQKEHELQLQKYSRELTKLNVDKDKFMSVLAHDLRNPFNTLLGFSQLLSKNIRKYDIDKIEKQVHIINNTASNTYKLLEDILLWSRTQSGKIVYEPNDFNFYEACKSIMEKVNNRALLKGISVKCNMSNKLNVFSDINLVETVVRNLVSNAIKFTNKGGTITIDAKETGNEIIVSVADTGVGIEKETLSEIFNIAEYKTTRGTDKEEGTGLGLQICKEFVEKMGGKIWVESEKGQGSIFHFTIPK